VKLIPAIDLKEGKCVRLSEGKEESSIIYNSNPVKLAKFFESEGCQRIHIIDLDAAFGKNVNNTKTILDIRNSISIDIELGGGIRTEKKISFWIENGINFLIIGSLAITEPNNLKQIARSFPEKLYVSLDDFNGRIMILGWVEESIFSTEQILNNYNKSKIKGFVYTDISRDGMLTGINIDKLKAYLDLSTKPFIVGGGLSGNNDIKNILSLHNPLLEGVIAGKSFYLNKINIKTVNKLLD
jgi:phosphoribosylformimino-5-aminoimidazole carboxamide ribotide isomerase